MKKWWVRSVVAGVVLIAGLSLIGTNQKQRAQKEEQRIVRAASVVASSNDKLLSVLNQVKPAGQAELDQVNAMLREHINWLNEMWAENRGLNQPLADAVEKQKVYFEKLLAYSTGVDQVTQHMEDSRQDAIRSCDKLGVDTSSMTNAQQLAEIQRKVVDVVGVAVLARQPKPSVVVASSGGPTLDVSTLPPAEQAYMAQIMPLIQRYDRLRGSGEFQRKVIDPVKLGTGSYDHDAIERAFYDRRTIKNELLSIGYPPARFADAHQQFYEVVNRSLQAIQYLANYNYTDFRHLSDQNSAQWPRVKRAYGL